MVLGDHFHFLWVTRLGHPDLPTQQNKNQVLALVQNQFGAPRACVHDG